MARSFPGQSSRCGRHPAGSGKANAQRPGRRLCDGDQKLMGFFVGLVMKATRGQADGKAVSALLRQRGR